MVVSGPFDMCHPLVNLHRVSITFNFLPLVVAFFLSLFQFVGDFLGLPNRLCADRGRLSIESILLVTWQSSFSISVRHFLRSSLGLHLSFPYVLVGSGAVGSSSCAAAAQVHLSFVKVPCFAVLGSAALFSPFLYGRLLCLVVSFAWFCGARPPVCLFSFVCRQFLVEGQS